MAGSGIKTFSAGDILTASDVNGYLMQGVLVFTNSAGRSSAFTSASQTPTAGMVSFLTATNALEIYNGTAWIPYGTLGAWTTYSPVITPATGAFTTLTYTSQIGAYQQIGKVVHFRVLLVINAFTIGTGAGNISVSLPVSATSTQIVAGKFYDGTNTTRLVASISGTTLNNLSNSDTTFLQASNLAASRQILFTGTYEAS